MSHEREATDEGGVDSVGHAVLRTLRSYGISTVFGIPGTHNLELYRPLHALGIQAVTTRHEQGAGYAADGWSQQAGLPGVVITTSGPGLQNVMSAVGTAYCESRPLIVISPGAPLGEEFSDRGSLHETKDSSAMVAAVAEWSRRVRTAEDAVEAVHDAFTLFRTGRPRPVHIEIPLDVLESPACIPLERCDARPLDDTLGVDDDDLWRSVSILQDAHRPVILAGGGATSASHEVTSLAEKLRAPVVTTLNGKGVVDERHPLSVGANLRLAAARELLESADVLVVIGSKLGEAELWVPSLKPRGRVIRIDISQAQLHKNLAADVAMQGSAARVIEQLLALLPESNRSLPDLDPVRAKIEAQIWEADPATADLGAQIVAAIPSNAIVAGDSSQIVYLGVANQLQLAEPHSLLYMPTFATLGYGLPAAIGARIAEPSRPVIAVIGDGALMFCVNELATAAEQQLDLTVICVDNGGYAEIKQNEIDLGISPIGVDLWQPDWPMLATALGATGVVVEPGDSLNSAIVEAVDAGGLRFIHLVHPASEVHSSTATTERSS